MLEHKELSYYYCIDYSTYLGLLGIERIGFLIKQTY